MKKTTTKQQQKPIGLPIKNRDTNNTQNEICGLKAGSIDKERNLEQLIDRCTKCRERHQTFFSLILKKL